MPTFKQRIRREPVVTRAMIHALVQAAFACAVAWGLRVTAEQAATTIAFVNSILVVVFALWSRAKVTPIDE
jgi:hypothetical protein